MTKGAIKQRRFRANRTKDQVEADRKKENELSRKKWKKGGESRDKKMERSANNYHTKYSKDEDYKEKKRKYGKNYDEKVRAAGPYPCPLCEVQYSLPRSLFAHLRDVHSTYNA
jgi:hypothetical protein